MKYQTYWALNTNIIGTILLYLGVAVCIIKPDYWAFSVLCVVIGLFPIFSKDILSLSKRFRDWWEEVKDTEV